jgi:hypothetical protein
MSPGRNDPCYCGSGKKYKKCCLSKDERARKNEEAESAGTPTDPQSRTGREARKRESDPLVEDWQARWREFREADYEDQIALFLRTLDDPELMDAEMAFEMLNEIFRASAERQERDRFDELVRRLQERRPDVYVKEKSFFLKWRITNALVAGRPEDVSNLTLELAPLASKDIDIFNRVEERISYHGHLATVVEAMRLAWPGVRSSSEIVPWGIDEFCTRAVTYEMLHYAGSSSEPDPDNPTLAERLEFFSQIESKQVAAYLEHITAWPGRMWTMSDFQFAPPHDRWENDEGDAEETESDLPGDTLNFYLLTVQFLGYLRRFESVPYAKGELGRRDLYRFILERLEGKLEYRESMMESMQRELDHQQGRRRRPIRKFKSYEHALVADAERLEHYLAGLLDMMNQLYHRAAALFEIIPPWLRFLEARRLIHAEIRVQALAGLEPLADKLCRVLDSYADDPSPLRAIQGWREDARKAVPGLRKAD